MSYKPPQPFDWELAKAVFSAIVLTVTVAFSLYYQFAAPCSWHRFVGITNVPSRCVRELVGEGAKR